MGINRAGLKRLIDIVQKAPQSMIGLSLAIEITELLGLGWHLKCEANSWSERVRLLMASPDLGPIELQIETPFGVTSVPLSEVSQRGPASWERHGTFNWPMDRFLLALAWQDKEESVTINGPTMAVLARGYLYDETDPAVGVCNFACSVLQLLTGESVDTGNFIGAGFVAKYRSEKAVEALSRYAETLGTEAP
jgi:hypothetical protein